MARKRKRKNPDKGWAKSAPEHVGARRKLAKRCGKRCFADPKKLKYPMCDKPKKGERKKKMCSVDCRGALAAFSRARQYKNTTAAKNALKAGIQSGCSWTDTGQKAQELRKKWRM